jgi:UDPglucose--hexose-1-phosphate uridylyltransferase
MPEDWCPFCPGSSKVPDQYDVYKYDNDFPALSLDPPKPDNVGTNFFKVRSAYGKCEVILYSPKHTATLAELPVMHIRKIVDLWVERFHEIKKDRKIKYIFIFENRGDVVGVTMPHPHGQIYGYSVIPKKLRIELGACMEHYHETGSCLLCDMLRAEQDFEKRIIFENAHFTCFLPFFTEYPYGVYILSKSHKSTIDEFGDEEKDALAAILKETVGMMDSLFDYRFPYMMCMHNAPVNGMDASDYYHFHIEFFPPMRSAEKQKFNASSETGAWAHCNPTSPEEKAKELQQAHKKYIAALD